ncbi:sensor domain-containing diguanylate cyclase [Gracilinema caldarium]|uniref:sensor domain-containing diguanylate cyclase n=1 Tax=Gracilinema caldarium TaxID=215591 RepID=UPI0026E931AB|nr:sensor domain-containing diguanylate cyclase [Gracilinema caldarium]
MEQNQKTEQIESLKNELLAAWRLCNTEPSSALSQSELLLQQSRAIHYKKGEGWALLIQAKASFQITDFESAKQAIGKAIELFQKYRDIEGLAESFVIESALFIQQGALDKALEDATKTLEIAKEGEYPLLETKAANRIGEVLLKAGAVHQGLEYFMRAASSLKKYESIQDNQQNNKRDILELQARLFSNLGLAFLEIGETSNSIEYLELALGCAEQNQDKGSLLFILKGLSVAYRRTGDRKKAGDLLFEALDLAKQSKQNLVLLDLKLEQALLLIESDIYLEAIEALNGIIQDALKNQLIPILTEAYRLRSLAFELSGDSASALEDYKQFHKYQEDLSGEQIAQSKKDAEILFELERAKNEAEIYRLRNVELRKHKEELEQSNQRLKAVMEIAKVVTASLDIQVIAQTVHASLMHLMDASGFSLVQYDEIHDQIHFILFLEDDTIHEPFTIAADSQDSFAAYVVKHKEFIKLDDIDAEYAQYVKNPTHLGGRKTKSMMYAPLLVGGKVVGALSVQSMKTGAYTNEDGELLRSVSTFIAIAMENSRTHDELLRLNQDLQAEKDALEQLTKKVSRLANHDGLTGLPNRLLLGELLEKAILRAARHSTLVAVLFMDLDNFKPINDRFGHHAGDLALIEVAHRFKNALRAMDVIARVGGDEFVALLTDLDDPQAASIVSEKLLDALRNPVIVNNTPCELGVSIGIALYPRDGKLADDLLHRADEAMYEIKRENKNGYAFYRHEKK